MKLLTKTNTYSLLFLLLLAPAMMAVDYYLIQSLVITEVDELLKHECARIQFNLDTSGEFPRSDFLMDTTHLLGTASAPARFQDTLLYEAYADKYIPYRVGTCTVSAAPNSIRVFLRYQLWEMNELIVWLFISTTLVLLLVAGGLYVIHYRVAKWAWKPFFENLSTLENYDITQKTPVQLQPSSISEFDALNKLIVKLMTQIKKDFQHLKEFNENISHEMQTPLAIIRNKMVLLLDSSQLGEKELRWVQAAYEEVNKISKIGKSLTLISRIENEEFNRLKTVNVLGVIDNILSNMEEMISYKELKVSTEFAPASVKGDPILINILFTNLIKNAVQHNQDGGFVKLYLYEKGFEIENAGKVLEGETSRLFNRFEKGVKTSNTLGLGLAISQRICDLYHFQLKYQHESGRHRFTLRF